MKKVCGLHMRKDNISCAIYDGKNKRSKRVQRFYIFHSKDEREYLPTEDVRDIAMENTGIYQIEVWNILEQEGFSSDAGQPVSN